MVIALFGREIDQTAAGRLEKLLEQLHKKDVELVYYAPFLHFLKDKAEIKIPEGTVFSNTDEIPSMTDFILSIGGDGTFLSAVSIIKTRIIPIAGVNFGRLGFLTTVQPDEDNLWIDDLINGRYWVGRRMLLKIESDLIPNDFYPFAVNEMAIQRKALSMISVKVSIDGKPLPAYWSDGIVVSTPTGSTAYNLSIGGPIVEPEANVLIISPIAPHNLNVRPLIVSASSRLEIEFTTRGDNATISVDNRYFESGESGRIFVSNAEFGFLYVSLSNNTFIEALKEKLLWGEDKRNAGLFKK